MTDACSLDPLQSFAAAARKMGAYGLMRCSSGNLSCRLDAQRMLVKSSRSWMADLTAQDVSICRIADAQHLDGRKPSVEIGFHAGCLRVRPDINVVLHFQTPAATTLACSKNLRQINFFAIPEMAYYIGPIGIVPYILPGTAKLAEAVTETMRNHDLAILASHGQVTVGKDFDDVIQKATFFELACEIILRAGPNLQPLPPAAIAELRPGASPAARGV